MKNEMTSFDIMAIVQELQVLEGARIKKIFQVGERELKVQLNTKEQGRVDLVIEAGVRMHITEFPKPSPKVAGNFAMTLRKYLSNTIIEGIKQVQFDRIVEFKVKGREDYVLIAELFGKGNIILADREGIIKAVFKPQRFKDRDVVGKVKYEYPPPKLNPFELSAIGLRDAINASELSLVKTLATNLGLGGLYAEELCLMTGILKDREAVDEGEAQAIYDALMTLKNKIGGGDARIVFDDGQLDVVPAMLVSYKGRRTKKFESFNRALDEYFTKLEVRKVDSEVEEKFRQKIGRIENQIKKQEAMLERLERLEKDSRDIGDLIYANLAQIDDILNAISVAKKRYSYSEIRKKIEEKKDDIAELKQIKKILLGENAIILDIDGKEIRLDLSKNAAKNADLYYTKGKKAKSKIGGTISAIEESRKLLEEIRAKGRNAIELKEKKPEKRVVKKKEWYEKFRWFISSDGYLVLGGRDANSNEALVKRHMDGKDIFVHADIHGAPAVVIKTEGKEVPEQTIQEAFDFASSYSKAWKHSVFGLDVYWVTPEQVSKRAEHGEYIPRGGFIIRGRRNWGRGEVKCAIGINEKFKIIGGPFSAIEKHSKYYVMITPGRKKSGEIAGEIKKRFLEAAKKEDREKIAKISLEEIQEFLPAGGSDIAKEK